MNFCARRSPGHFSSELTYNTMVDLTTMTCAATYLDHIHDICFVPLINSLLHMQTIKHTIDVSFVNGKGSTSSHACLHRCNEVTWGTHELHDYTGVPAHIGVVLPCHDACIQGMH